MEETHDHEVYGIAILDVPIAWSEKILESHKLANLLIIALVVLAALALAGIGYFATYPYSPAHAQETLAPSAQA